jgi:predicted RNA binding protein YcfA (HicA-like mRNA interferase family)
MIVVPVHPGDLKPGTARTIIQSTGLQPEEFLELLK